MIDVQKNLKSLVLVKTLFNSVGHFPYPKNYLSVLLRNFFVFAVNKQLNDKERVAAAFENPNLVDLVEKCLVSSEE